MPPHRAARGLRRAELITPAPGDAAVFLQRLLGWLALYAESGFDCWVGERQCASIRGPGSGQATGWHLMFAGGAHDGSLTGPDDAQARIRKGRAQHGPWAPAPRPGEPTWIDLLTVEPERADVFWTDTLCWEVRSSGEHATYTADGRPVAGRIPRYRTDGERGWLCYFAVQDVDEAGERVEELGGKILERLDHPVLGTALRITDPHGAVLALSRATQSWGNLDPAALSPAESSPST